MPQNLFADLAQLLRMDSRFCTEDGHLLKNKIVEAALAVDPLLLQHLLTHEAIRKQFFTDVAGTLVFDKVKFQHFVMNKSFLPDSYTMFKNKIGLVNENGDFISESREVVLSWPYKDCILEGGQTKEDAKRNEIFWNETLAPDEITRLTEPKAFTHFRRYDSQGEHEVTSISKSDNLIIKGNNLLALYSLRKVYAGQIKLIYIDPPYNTGNDSFGYNDSFNHSTWLTFMKNRLEIAKELLKNDGVIFIQCDDNEQAYLKVLCDKIFGRENMICNFIWQKKTGASDANNVATITEYTLLYAKCLKAEMCAFNTESYDYKRYRLSDEYENRRGKYYIDNLDRGGLSYSDSLNYGIECPDGVIAYPNGRTEFIRDGWIWKWGKEKVQWAIENGFIEFRKSNTKKTGWSICYKNYLLVDNENNPIQRAAPYKNLILDVLNNDAAKEMKSLFGEKAFAYPKPEKLLQKYIALCSNESDIVLDFCLGSGTTAAVAHKMNRRYIGIEQMDYIRTIDVERLKKVIAGEQGGISQSVDWNPQNPTLTDGDKYKHNSFVYLELAEANQAFVTDIEAAATTDQLSSIWQRMQQNGFLSYRISPKQINSAVQDWTELALSDQKRFLIECLDMNLLYVPFSDMDDSTNALSEKDKQLTRQFYANK